MKIIDTSIFEYKPNYKIKYYAGPRFRCRKGSLTPIAEIKWLLQWEFTVLGLLMYWLLRIMLPPMNFFFSMKVNFEVAKLTWVNGQLAMHELGTIYPALSKPTRNGGIGRVTDTLEFIVHQATYYNSKQIPNSMTASASHQKKLGIQNMENVGSLVVASSSRGKWAENYGHLQTALVLRALKIVLA